MAEKEIIKHTKAIVELSTDRKKPWRHRVKEVIGEILIIVFAVSISIWFHNSYYGPVHQRFYTLGIDKCQLIIREIDKELR